MLNYSNYYPCDIWKMFYEQNPYDQFDYRKYPHDVIGFEGHSIVFKEIVDQFKPKLSLEVGSYKGQSSISIAKAIVDYGHLICVDTWLGSSEFFLYEFGTKQRSDRNLHLVNGYPSLYYYFLANICYENLQNYVTPFSSTSMTAQVVFKS